MAPRKTTKRKTPREAAEARAATLRARLESEQLKAALSYYRAADKGRKNRDWPARMHSADLAIIPDALTVVARSRDAVANTWIGRAAQRSHKRNVIGRGIMVVPTARDPDGKDLPKLNRRASDLWMRWASDKTACDLERRRTYWQQQRTIASEEFVAGESFEVWSYVQNPRNVGLRMQLFESEQLDLTIQAWEGNQVRGGVEVDQYGAAVAYHFYKRNPSDYLNATALQSARVPAERVRHYFDAERVLQTRGMPQMAPVLNDVRDFSSFKDANLWRARMEACITFIIKKTMPTPAGGIAGIGPRLSGDTGATATGMRTMDMIPGMVPELMPGEDIEPFIPSAPGNQYEPFTAVTLRGIGAGVGMSFGALTRENNANYSAARQDMLEDEREIGPQQDHFIDTVLLPDYELWFRFAALEGRFDDVEGFDLAEYLAEPERFCEAEYIAPQRPWIDPEKEANAYAKAIELRIITRNEIVAMRGSRLKNVLQTIASEREDAKAEGITFPEDVDAKATAAAAFADIGKGNAQNATADATEQQTTDAADSGPDGSGDSAPPSKGNMADRARPRRVTLAQADAPNYRSAAAPEIACSTCSYAVGMYCKAYDFTFTPGFVCDAWEATPPTDATPTGKLIGVQRTDGEPPIDSPGGFNSGAPY